MSENPNGPATFQTVEPSAAVFDLVDGTESRQTTTLPAGTISGRYCPLYLAVVGIDISGINLSPPNIKIGNNSPNYDNLLPSTKLSGVVATDDCWMMVLPSKTKAAEGDKDMVLTVTGISTFNTYIFRVYLVGLTG